MFIRIAPISSTSVDSFAATWLQVKDILLDCNLSSPGTRPIICIDECQVWNIFKKSEPRTLGIRALSILLSVSVIKQCIYIVGFTLHRALGHIEENISGFEHDPHTIYKCFLNRSASLNSFSLFSSLLIICVLSWLIHCFGRDAGHNEVTRLWCCGEYLQLYLNNSCFLLKWFEKFKV